MAKKEKGALSVKAGADAAKKVANNFKSFAFKGNIVDMAVGVVVGSAFTAIVNSLVKDLITPLLTLITGSAKYEDLFVVLKYPAGAEGASYATLAEAAEAGRAAAAAQARRGRRDRGRGLRGLEGFV